MSKVSNYFFNLKENGRKNQLILIIQDHVCSKHSSTELSLECKKKIKVFKKSLDRHFSNWLQNWKKNSIRYSMMCIIQMDNDAEENSIVHLRTNQR